MKSSYELAMERLEKQSGKSKTLTPAQRSAIAEVENQARAKSAELEIMFGPRLADVAAKGDPAEQDEVRRQKADGLRKIKEECEAARERIRAGS